MKFTWEKWNLGSVYQPANAKVSVFKLWFNIANRHCTWNQNHHFVWERVTSELGWYRAENLPG